LKNVTAKVYRDHTDKMTRDEWLAARKNGIGGSEASAVLGVNPYSSPLKVYRDKLSQDTEDVTNEAMRQGHDFEDYVARRFQEETGMKVRRLNRILQNPDHPWMLANIDRDIVGEDAGLEIKTTSALNLKRFKGGEFPANYYCQCVHYMAVTGAGRWYVAILVLGKSFHVFEIDRNEDDIRTLTDAEEVFWKENVEAKIPPLPTGSDTDDEEIIDVSAGGGRRR